MHSHVVRVALAVTDQLWSTVYIYVVVMYFDFDGSMFELSLFVCSEVGLHSKFYYNISLCMHQLLRYSGASVQRLYVLMNVSY